MNRKLKLLTILTLPLLAFVLLLTTNQTQAQTAGGGFNIELSPGKINVNIQPGDTFTQTFRIGNYSGADKTLYFYVQDFTVINEAGTPTFFENDALDEEAKRFALSQWVQLPYESLTVENNKVVEIDALITVPTDAEAGGHYGAFFVQTQRPDSEGTAIGSVGRIASLMLINVPGDVEENIDIVNAFTDKSVYFGDDPEVNFVTMLKNTGNVHGIPVGAFNVSGGFAARSKSVIFNQDQGAVLPGAPERRIETKFALDSKGGIVPPIGKFTIDLVARYGTSNLPLETTIFFWLLPARFIAVSVIVTVLVVFVLWRAIVSFKK